MSRTVANLLEDVKILSGQHIMDTLELDATKFQTMVERVVFPMFGRYRPKITNRNITVNGPSYTFVSDIPDFINKIVPVSPLLNPLAIVFNPGQSIDSPVKGLTPNPIDYRYQKPTLYTPIAGEMNVYCSNSPGLVAVGSPITDYTITFLDDGEYPLIVKLANGFFMTSIAMTRKIGTIQGLDIAFDGDTLLTHANDKLLEAMTELKSNSKWWSVL